MQLEFLADRGLLLYPMEIPLVNSTATSGYSELPFSETADKLSELFHSNPGV